MSSNIIQYEPTPAHGPYTALLRMNGKLHHQLCYSLKTYTNGIEFVSPSAQNFVYDGEKKTKNPKRWSSHTPIEMAFVC